MPQRAERVEAPPSATLPPRWGTTPLLGYDIASHERAPTFQPGPPWSPSELPGHLAQRAEEHKAHRRLLVNYYRIGHVLSFPLPLTRTPDAFPPGIPGWDQYPWRIWLTWALEERWGVLHAAWRRLGDEQAGELLRRELVALAGWETFRETKARVHLATAHLAGCLSMALAQPQGWPAEQIEALRAAGRRMIDDDFAPWFREQWEQAPEPPLVNIPIITLTRAAQLARLVDHALTEAMDTHAAQYLDRWSRLRLGGYHSEGTAYDGYLMDSLTAWLLGIPGAEGWPGAEALLSANEAALHTLLDAWIQVTVPGRPDLHPPLGDVEPQMPFWITPLLRLAVALNRQDEAWWLVRHMAPARLPAAALDLVMEWAEAHRGDFPGDQPEPTGRSTRLPGEHAEVAALRSGYGRADVLAAISLPRCGMSHLQRDAGSLVLAWQGRCWITDPGYRQYRPGVEQDYTLGLLAHNAPVIDGKAQSRPSPKVLEIAGEGDRQHIAIDLTHCYDGLPAEAAVRRDVWLIPAAADGGGDGAVALHWVMVRDTFEGFADGTSLRTTWHGGTDLGWRFEPGWACLDDGVHSVWFTTRRNPADDDTAGDPGLTPAGLLRHEGTRGPLSLTHDATLAGSRDTRWWYFACGDLDHPPTTLPG